MGGSVVHAGQAGELTSEDAGAGGGVASVPGDAGRTRRTVSACEAPGSAGDAPRLEEVEPTCTASALRDV